MLLQTTTSISCQDTCLKMAALGQQRRVRPLNYGEVMLFKEKSLGVGSYGKVCRALCGQLPCAAKLLHDTLFHHGDPGEHNLTDQFDRECQFLSTVHHPNIVQYLTTLRDSHTGRSVLLMELLDQSLTKFLEQSRAPIPYHLQVGICHDISLALSYLHLNGIIHRDLSSNNILLTSGKRAKVTDFGMSKLIDTKQMTALTKVPGAEVYMPPEAKTVPPTYTDKIDCFSFGVLVIQIATRNFPKPGNANRFENNPAYPGGRVLVVFPERDRRKNDIDLIDCHHPLLETALQCIEDRDEDRPSSRHICKTLTAMREKHHPPEEEGGGVEGKKSEVLTLQLSEQKRKRISNENERLLRELDEKKLLEQQLQQHLQIQQQESDHLQKLLKKEREMVSDHQARERLHAEEMRTLTNKLGQAKEDTLYFRRELDRLRGLDEEVRRRQQEVEELRRCSETREQAHKAAVDKLTRQLTSLEVDHHALRDNYDKSRRELLNKDEELRKLSRAAHDPKPTIPSVEGVSFRCKAWSG